MNLRQVREALENGTRRGDGDGRSLMFPEARDPKRWAGAAAAHAFTPEIEEIRTAAAGFRTQAPPELPFSLYRLYDETGDRQRYQAAYFSVRKRLGTFALLSLLKGEAEAGGAENLRGTEDALWSICDEYTWCLPAHLGGKSLDASCCPEHPETLDLFNCETAFTLSELLFLLEGKISPFVARRVSDEVFRRVLRPYAALTPERWWETTDMNWAAVCAGSVGAAAMYRIPDDDELAPILLRVLSTAECYLSGFYEDGFCREGIGYWDYGFGFFTYFAVLLQERTAGAIRLLDDPKVREIALFQQRIYLDDRHAASYSDSGLTHRFLPGLACRLKKVEPRIEFPDWSARTGAFGDDCSRWQHMVRNFVWCEKTAPQGGLSEESFFFRNAGVWVSRVKRQDGFQSFSAKAGDNGEPHNHNDVGSFQFLDRGRSILCDPGRGVYTREYFGSQRYGLLCNGSQGHSVPIVDGCFQQAGPEFSGTVLTARSEPREDAFELEMAGAYGLANLLSLVRRFRFKREKAELVLQDVFTFRHAPDSVVERFVTFFRPEPAAGRVLLGQPAAVLEFDADGLDVCVRPEKFPTEAGCETLYEIDFTPRIPTESMCFRFTVRGTDGPEGRE